MNKLTREAVSRTTLGLIAAALLYASVVCFRTAGQWRREWRERHPQQVAGMPRQRDFSGSGVATLAGIVLVPAGLFILATAVVPSSWLLRIFPLRNITLHENPDASNPHGPWR